jgi:hypothetical protein
MIVLRETPISVELHEDGGVVLQENVQSIIITGEGLMPVPVLSNGLENIHAYAMLESDISVSNLNTGATLIDLLTLAVVPGAYKLEAVMIVSCTNVNPDAKFAIVAPTGTTGNCMFWGYTTAVSALTNSFPNEAPFRFTGSPPTSGPAVAGLQTSGETMCIIQGLAVVTTAGNLVLQGAQNTSGATPVVFQDTSWFAAMRVG